MLKGTLPYPNENMRGRLHPCGAKFFLQCSYLQTNDPKQKNIITGGMITMAATPDFDLFPRKYMASTAHTAADGSLDIAS